MSLDDGITSQIAHERHVKDHRVILSFLRCDIDLLQGRQLDPEDNDVMTSLFGDNTDLRDFMRTIVRQLMRTMAGIKPPPFDEIEGVEPS